MLTAKICVRYKGDWTAQLRKYDVFGEFFASTFRNHQYIGIVAIETTDLDATLEVISEHETIESTTIIERHERDHARTATATVFVCGTLQEFSPLQTLIYEGFLPIGPTALENGRECFDLLLTDRAELSDAVELLKAFGNVNVERISREFSHRVTPSVAEWQELLASIPPRQREVLNTALDYGYFNIPREATLAEIADEMGITKTTASNHLRKGERKVMEFLITYLNLAAMGN